MTELVTWQTVELCSAGTLTAEDLRQLVVAGQDPDVTTRVVTAAGEPIGYARPTLVDGDRLLGTVALATAHAPEAAAAWPRATAHLGPVMTSSGRYHALALTDVTLAAPVALAAPPAAPLTDTQAWASAFAPGPVHAAAPNTVDPSAIAWADNTIGLCTGTPVHLTAPHADNAAWAAWEAATFPQLSR